MLDQKIDREYLALSSRRFPQLPSNFIVDLDLDMLSFLLLLHRVPDEIIDMKI